ncbi:hypothetical protein [Chryseobacterium gambrini]|uniref:hypothetical protein n=1 Tax=Chryseobacterium gambrini TaxID=373672 RepID=UPI003D0C6D76
MKTKFYFFIVISMITFNIKAQEELTKDYSEYPNGYRFKEGARDFIIYRDNNLKIDLSQHKIINSSVRFKLLNETTRDLQGIKYVLIAIPTITKSKTTNNDYIDSLDSGKSFWIKETDLKEENIDVNYQKWSQNFISGILTAPFKYRFGGSNESLIDGDFNIASFLGWKIRVTQIRSYYFIPFIFGGVTTLKYNSANNFKITDSSVEENGNGFTYGGGFSVRLGNISPGIIIGYDRGTRNMGSGFIYNNKPWLSFSLNYDFFKPKEASKNGN